MYIDDEESNLRCVTNKDNFNRQCDSYVRLRGGGLVTKPPSNPPVFTYCEAQAPEIHLRMPCHSLENGLLLMYIQSVHI